MNVLLGHLGGGEPGSGLFRFNKIRSRAVSGFDMESEKADFKTPADSECLVDPSEYEDPNADTNAFNS